MSESRSVRSRDLNRRPNPGDTAFGQIFMSNFAFDADDSDLDLRNGSSKVAFGVPFNTEFRYTADQLMLFRRGPTAESFGTNDSCPATGQFLQSAATSPDSHA